MVGDQKKWRREDIEKMITNPVYCGIGPYPAIIDDETFVKAAARAIRELGPKRYIRRVLENLRKSFPTDDELSAENHGGTE